MKKSIKKILKCIAIVACVTMLFSTYAFAFGIECNFKSIPKTVYKNQTGTFKLGLTYDSTVYGIPIPVDAHMGAEIPYSPFKEPKYVSGTFKYMNFEKATGARTGAKVWQCYRTWLLIGESDEEFKVQAKAEPWSGSGKASLGTGNTMSSYNYSSTVTVK